MQKNISRNKNALNFQKTVQNCTKKVKNALKIQKTVQKVYDTKYNLVTFQTIKFAYGLKSSFVAK